MRLKDYKSSDIEEVIEIKGMALHQLEAIEKCIWTDSIEEATARAFHLFEELCKIRKMKQEAEKEKNFSFLVAKLSEMGVHAHAIKFGHKKTD